MLSKEKAPSSEFGSNTDHSPMAKIGIIKSEVLVWSRDAGKTVMELRKVSSTSPLSS